MLNGLFVFVVVTSILLAALAGRMAELTQAVLESAGAAVTLAIGLIGVMAFFLGLMRVAEDGGLLRRVARAIGPAMQRLFPTVPVDHPAMSAMILNIASNMLGLGNAATPFGIRAIEELDKLNGRKGTATNAMVLFLAINTSSVTLLPTGVIALRAATGSADPAGVVPTTLFATICSTTVAIIAAKFFQRFSPSPTVAGVPDAEAFSAEGSDGDPTLGQAPASEAGALEAEEGHAYPAWISLTVLGTIVAIIPLTILYGRTIAPWIIPGLMVGLLGFGVARRVRVYESFVEGAKEGFYVALRIIPYLVAILVAVGMFRASGAMEMLNGLLGAVTGLLGLPADALPMALLRPLSGSGAYGVLASIIENPAIGPDSYTGYLVSTIQGSTETTFYVIAVYFGAVQVRRIRHALAAGITADLAGIAGAVLICAILFGG